MVNYHRATPQEPRRRTLADIIGRGAPVTRPWGRVDSTSFAGREATRINLIIFPPGTQRADRFWADLFSSIIGSTAGGVLTLGAAVTVSVLLPLPSLLVRAAVAVGAVVLVIVASWIGGRRLLNRSHGISETYSGTAGSLADQSTLLGEFVAKLDELDRPGIAPVEYERRWGEIYAELSAKPAARTTQSTNEGMN